MMRAVDLVKIYKGVNSNQQVAALRGCDFHLGEGEFVSVVGPSGAGKTTLLRILGGIEKPSSGKITLDNASLTEKSPSQLREIRRNKIGFVSQFPEENLMYGLSVSKNLELAMRICNCSRKEIRKRKKFLLETFDLEAMQQRNAAFLSGGEKMRASLAIALAKEPRLILADEPTGQLDSPRTIAIRRFLRQISRDWNVAVVVATHDLRFRIDVDRTLTISDGRLVRVEGTIEPEAAHEEATRVIAHIDSTGFIQVPQHFLNRLGLTDKAELEIDPSNSFVTLRNPEKPAVKIVIPEKFSEELQETPIATEVVFNKEIGGSPLTMAALQGVSVTYGTGSNSVTALQDINLTISHGEIVAIVGPSGSGKSTLLRIIAGLEKPSSGEAVLLDQNLTEMADSSRAAVRAQNLGLMAQEANLHPSFTISDNIKLPFLLQGQNPNTEDALAMLETLEILDKIGSFPLQLSGGERQRAGLVLALTANPRLILLDEPTAHVESSLAAKMIGFILKKAKEQQFSLVLATHDLTLLRPGFRVISLDSGRKIADDILDEEMRKEMVKRFFAS